VTRHYKELVGVLVREDVESDILYVEHVYEFNTPGCDRGVYVQCSYGFSLFRSFNDLVACQESLWAPVLGLCYKDRGHYPRQVYLAFDKTKHPKYLGLRGDWVSYAER